MRKTTACAVCLALLFLTSPAFPDMKTFIREYSYDAAEMDSRISCRYIALEQVKRLLLEELGTYVESVTTVNNYQVDRDQINILTAGVVQTKILDEKWDGKQYWLKAEIAADPDEVAEAVNQLKDNQQLMADLKEAREEATTALAEVESLKLALADATTAREDRARYDESIRQLQATDLFERGQYYATAGDYQRAIAAYDRAATLRPGDSKLYSNRGTTYVLMGNYQQAFSDFNRAIKLNPRKTTFYEQRKITDKMIRTPGRITPGEKRYFEKRMIKWTTQVKQERRPEPRPPEQLRRTGERAGDRMPAGQDQEKLRQKDRQNRQAVERQQWEQRREADRVRQQKEKDRHNRQAVERRQWEQRREADKIRQQREKDRRQQTGHPQQVQQRDTKTKKDSRAAPYRRDKDDGHHDRK